MSMSECGPALIAIYVNGIRECVLRHEHDGGEHYMVPLLRHAVKYAKTHYDDGDIVAVLRSEPEMQVMRENKTGTLKNHGCRHVYYVSWRWDAEAARKSYWAHAAHTDGKTFPPVPEAFSDIPVTAVRLV